METSHWTPLIYQYRNMAFRSGSAYTDSATWRLITPLRDGMNLVAKEFVASRPDQTGVLILSEMAGAAQEMGEALIINPFHIEEFAEALEPALEMPVEEQKRRNQAIQDRLRRYDVNRWAEDFVQTIISTHQSEAARRARSLTGRAHTSLVQHYRTATKRTLLLDYDGTLVPFAGQPRPARPDKALVNMLNELAKIPRMN